MFIRQDSYVTINFTAEELNFSRADVSTVVLCNSVILPVLFPSVVLWDSSPVVSDTNVQP